MQLRTLLVITICAMAILFSEAFMGSASYCGIGQQCMTPTNAYGTR